MDERILIESRDLKKYRDLDEICLHNRPGLLTVEKNAFLIMEILKIDDFERTRDVIQITYDLPLSEDEEFIQQVTILVTAEEYQFRLGTTEWTMGAYAPASTSRLWKRLIIKKTNPDEMEKRILEYFNMAINKMKADLKVCKYCKNKFPREHMFSNNICHGCAGNIGVVF